MGRWFYESLLQFWDTVWPFRSFFGNSTAPHVIFERLPLCHALADCAHRFRFIIFWFTAWRARLERWKVLFVDVHESKRYLVIKPRRLFGILFQ